MPLPEIGEERTIPMWLFGKQEVLVRFRWTGKVWENIDTVSFKRGAITIDIERNEWDYTITTGEEGEEEDGSETRDSGTD